MNRFLSILSFVSAPEGLLLSILPIMLIFGFLNINLIYIIITLAVFLVLQISISTMISKSKGLKHFIFYPIHPIILKVLIRFSNISVRLINTQENYYFIIHANIALVLKKDIKKATKNINADIQTIGKLNIQKNFVFVGNTFIDFSHRRQQQIEKVFFFQKVEGKFLRFRSKNYFLYLLKSK